MTSIYQRALGSDFSRLHPEIQRRFSLTSESGIASVGTGIMDRIWHGANYTVPFLYLGTWRSIMFPEQGRNVPFTIENYGYLDSLGRETVTWIRTFSTRKTRRFDAYMIYSEQRSRIVDYLGTHQHLAVDLELSVSPEGGIRIRSGEQRFYEGPVSFKFPLFFSGIADVHEWFDEKTGLFRVEMSAANQTWGPLFGYRGQFQVDWVPIAPSELPVVLQPCRVETRE